MTRAPLRGEGNRKSPPKKVPGLARSALLARSRSTGRDADLAAVKLEQYELKAIRLTVSRVKNGRTSIHTVEPKEKKALKELVGYRRTGYIFLTERGTPLTASGILKILARWT
jgi:hypothetical protein